MKPSQVLAIVADQFDEIRKQLDLQLQRTAQIQAQFDHLGGLVQRLLEEDGALSANGRSKLETVPEAR